MKNTIQYVAYYRVSTDKQGIKGLGIEAQQADVNRFLQGIKPIATFTEVESGGNNKRPELHKAIQHCITHNATLLIAKLDRLSRNVLFIETLRANGVKFVCCDMPDANEFVIGIMAQLAQYERKMISERTKKALAALKDRGVKLGGSTKEHCDNMRAAKKPVQYNTTVQHIIKTEREKQTPFDKIAGILNDLGYKTNRHKPYTSVAVYRIYQHILNVPRSQKS